MILWVNDMGNYTKFITEANSWIDEQQKICDNDLVSNRELETTDDFLDKLYSKLELVGKFVGEIRLLCIDKDLLVMERELLNLDAVKNHRQAQLNEAKSNVILKKNVLKIKKSELGITGSGDHLNRSAMGRLDRRLKDLSNYPYHGMSKRAKLHFSVLSLLDDEDENGCRLWLGDRKGKFGTIRTANKYRLVHDVVYDMYHVVFDNDKGYFEVKHTCDNSLCCTPDHLYRVVTKKLIETISIENRNSPVPYISLSYNISHALVNRIRIDPDSCVGLKPNYKL